MLGLRRCDPDCAHPTWPQPTSARAERRQSVEDARFRSADRAYSDGVKTKELKRRHGVWSETIVHVRFASSRAPVPAALFSSRQAASGMD